MEPKPNDADRARPEHAAHFVGEALRGLYWPIAQEPLPFRYGRALGSLFVATTEVSALPRGTQGDWRPPASEQGPLAGGQTVNGSNPSGIEDR